MFSRNFQFSLTGSDVLVYSLESAERLLKEQVERYGDIFFIEKMIRNKTFVPRFRISLVHPDGVLKESFSSRDVLLGGTYQENFQSGQRRSLSFSLFNRDGRFSPSINTLWVNTQIFFECGMELPQYGITIWFPKGVFVVDSVKASNRLGQRTVQVECSDKFKLLEGSAGRLSTTYVVPANSKLSSVVTDLLLLDNGAGRPIDLQPVLIHSSLQRRLVPIKINEQPGSSMGELLRNVCESVSSDVFYNALGNLTLVPLEDIIRDTSKPLIYTYTASEGNFSGDDLNLNYEDMINRVIVVGGTINGHQCRAEALNRGDLSALSISRIGERTAPVINDSNISSDRLAQERADYELRSATIQKTLFSIGVFLNPLLTVGNNIAVTDEFFGLNSARFTIQSLSFNLDYTGDMSVTIANINNLTFA